MFSWKVDPSPDNFKLSLVSMVVTFCMFVNCGMFSNIFLCTMQLWAHIFFLNIALSNVCEAAVFFPLFLQSFCQPQSLIQLWDSYNYGDNQIKSHVQQNVLFHLSSVCFFCYFLNAQQVSADREDEGWPDMQHDQTWPDMTRHDQTCNMAKQKFLYPIDE